MGMQFDKLCVRGVCQGMLQRKKVDCLYPFFARVLAYNYFTDKNTVSQEPQCAPRFDASLSVRLLFKSIKHNAFYPVSSTQFLCRVAAMTKLGKCIVFYGFKQ